MKNRQIALVTGASSGMGKDFAKALLNEGFVVYAAARRIERMDDLKALGARPVQMDITKDSDIQNLIDTIQADGHSVDVLVNNAGFGLYGAIEDIPMDDARYQFEVNLFGLARLTQLILPSMRKNGAGKVINISSMGGKIYTPLGSWYHATKHALEGWSDCLRIEVQQFGIDVVVIEPGGIRTEFGDVMLKPMVEYSGEGAYSKMTKNMVSMFESMDPEKTGSDPSVITNLILKAVRAKKPKTRYVAGKFAKPLMFIRRWFGDRIYDKMLLRMFK